VPLAVKADGGIADHSYLLRLRQIPELVNHDKRRRIRGRTGLSRKRRANKKYRERRNQKALTHASPIFPKHSELKTIHDRTLLKAVLTIMDDNRPQRLSHKCFGLRITSLSG
jgi:hypothetical protein